MCQLYLTLVQSGFNMPLVEHTAASYFTRRFNSGQEREHCIPRMGKEMLAHLSVKDVKLGTTHRDRNTATSIRREIACNVELSNRSK